MEPLDLFSAMTDVDDQDVLEVLEIYTLKPKHRKIIGMIAVAATLILLVSVGIVAHWLLQREKGSTVEGGKTAGDHTIGSQLTGTVEPYNSPIAVEESPVCATYQFMFFRETEYSASIETSNRIGAKLGTSRVRNEEKESKTTLFKDVLVYEIVGTDPSIAVLVYYPEEQEYYVYYNANY